ncbi:MAG: hypothetical protein Kow0063_36700 [Anaerolineae bacterium]
MIGRRLSLRNLRSLSALIILLAFALAACTLGRSAPRPTPTPAVTSPPGPSPAITVPATPPPATPTPPTGLPEFAVEPARTIGDKLDMVPGQVIVKLQERSAFQALTARPAADGIIATGMDFIDRLNQFFQVRAFEPLIEPLARAAGESIETLGIQRPSLAGFYVLSFDPQYDPSEVASAYEDDPNVIYAEPNYLAYVSDQPLAPLAFTPNDPYFAFQWHMPQIQAPQAWDVSTGQDVLIAVLDTGIAYEDFGGFRRAPDLGNTRFEPGYDFINNDPHANDDEGHGTHVAGTIAQSTNNGQGVAGVAFNARLMPVKVLDSRGQGSHDAIAQGIVYATDRGARIINMSLSGRTGSSTLAEAINYAASKGVLVVAAAGNSGGAVEYPAAYESVLAVGAVGYDRSRVDYSNFGSQLDLVAPGGDTDADLNGDGYPDGILQETFRGDPTRFSFYFYEGTSMAAPHVSGVAALLFARNPAATASQVRQAMETTALDLGPGGRDNQYGYGLVQAADALAAIGGPQTPTPTPTPTPTFTVQPPTPTFTPTPPGPSPTPTPTITPIPPTPTPPVSGDIIINGGFETDEGWIFNPTRHPGSYSTQVVYSGARSARLGIVDGVDRYAYSSVVQLVTVPADARRATLSYRVYPISQDVFPRDIQMVLILNRRFRTIAIIDRTLSNAGQWIERSYDMTPFAGRTVYVYFGVYNGGRSGKTSAMYVDDVRLIVER